MTSLNSTIASALLALLCLSGLNDAWTAPAAWHTWRSKTNGTRICTQTSPGSGWERVDGPYKDARCTIAGKPGTR